MKSQVPTREIPVPLLEQITNYLLEGPSKYTYQMIKALDLLNQEFNAKNNVAMVSDEQSSSV